MSDPQHDPADPRRQTNAPASRPGIRRHRGQSVWLHGATCEIVELVELVGPREIVHLCPSCGSD